MFAAELSLAVETEHHRTALLADAERFRLARIASATRRVAHRRRSADPPPPVPSPRS